MQDELDKLYIRWMRSGIIVAELYTQPSQISVLRIRFDQNQAEKVSGTKGRHKGRRRGPPKYRPEQTTD